MLRKVIKEDNELFHAFNRCFNEFQNEFDTLYVLDIDKDTLSKIFDSNVAVTPIFRERPYWQCSTCKYTVRQIAKVVAITETYQKLPFLQYFLERYDIQYNYPFLSKMFKEFINLCEKSIVSNIFYSQGRLIGVERNVELESGLVFNHFYCEVNSKYLRKRDVNDSIQGLKATISKYYTHLDVLKDISFYINEGLVYRGIEKESLVDATLQLLQQYDEGIDINLFVWRNVNSTVSYFNNDVISTLADSLIEGKDPEQAVREYNKKVAPMNYRQPKTDIISPTQIKQTELELQKLGYEDFTEGFSFASPQDISVLDTLWTNRKVTSKGTLSSLLQANIKQPQVKLDKLQEINFEGFLESLKSCKSIEVDSSQLEKVVLVKDEFETPIFAWDNHINFCYQTGLADVDDVTRRVAGQGGEIDAKVRFSLYWENTDDLDLHLRKNKIHICYSNKSHPKTAFHLDIDMNVMDPIRGAVENIFCQKFQEEDFTGEFVVFVHNFTYRELPQKCILNTYVDNVLVKKFEFKNPPKKGKVNLVRFKLDRSKGVIFTWVNKELEKEVKLPIKYVEVDTVLLSPNYWLRGRGNKHLFFLKKREQIDLTNLRPFNIEQLRPELVNHRKVLHLLSKKIEIKGKPQLVGYGISFAKDRQIPIKINGRPYKLNIKSSEKVAQKLRRTLGVASSR